MKKLYKLTIAKNDLIEINEIQSIGLGGSRITENIENNSDYDPCKHK